MTAPETSRITLDHVDDFYDRIASFQNLYKDLLSSHRVAEMFGNQLDVVGTAIKDLSEQAELITLYARMPTTKRGQFLQEVKRLSKLSKPANAEDSAALSKPVSPPAPAPRRTRPS